MNIQHKVVIVPFPEPMYLVRDAEHKKVYEDIAVCAAYIWDEDVKKNLYVHGMDPQTLMMEAVNQAFIPVRIADKT